MNALSTTVLVRVPKTVYKELSMVLDQIRETGHSLKETECSMRAANSIDRRSWIKSLVLATALVVMTAVTTRTIAALLNIGLWRTWRLTKIDVMLLIVLLTAALSCVSYRKQKRSFSVLHGRLKQLENEAEASKQQHANRLFALANISQTMGAETDIQNIFDCITRMCVETFRCESASLMLFDRNTNELVVRSVHGDIGKNILHLRQEMGEGIAGWVASNREALLINEPGDLDNYLGLQLVRPEIVSSMVVPITVREELVGVLNVSSKSVGVRFSGEDLKALQVFAANAGTCIRHKEHVDWMRQMVPNLRGMKGGGK